MVNLSISPMQSITMICVVVALMSLTVASAAPNNLSVSKYNNSVKPIISNVSNNENPGRVISGTATVHNGRLFNLYNMAETSDINISDFWWGQLPSGERYLVPKNDATFAIIGVVDFETMNCSSVSASSYSSAKINGSIDNNQIPTGTVICAKTKSADAKFRIDTYGYDLRINLTLQPYSVPNLLYLYSIVYINSIPQGAQIWMDGKNTEKFTPDRFGPISEGSHTYELLLNGYLPYNDSFDIPNPESTPVYIDKEAALQTPTPTPTPTPEVTPTPTPIPTNSTSITPIAATSIAPTPTTPAVTYPVTTAPTATAFRNSIPATAVTTTSSIATPNLTSPFSTTSVSTTPTQVPGFLASSLLIAIFFVYLFMFKSRRR